jgi:fatty-acyl-CoA synthase
MPRRGREGGVTAAPERAAGLALYSVDEPDSARTHAELRTRSGRLAAALRARGVTAGDRVAVVGEGRPEIFELLYACARIGAILVPLNWRLAPAERAAVLADARPALLVDDSLLAALPGEVTGELPPATSRQPVLLLYTSGSTGRPRGVLIGWQQIACNARSTARVCRLGPGDRTLAFLPLFHTGGLNCLATPLLAVGGTVALMRRFDAERVVRLLRSECITAIIGVPGMYQLLLDAGLRARDVPALRCLLVGGAPCPMPLLAAWRERGLALWQGYGMTEAGPNCFTFGPRDGTVGQPVPGTEARLADDGELMLRGPHLALGYWNQREPLVDAGGWLATGDCAARDEEGNFRIVGRKKEMYISGGENVFPAEVELALSEHPAVHEVAVIGVADARWGEVGLAAVVARSPVQPDELRTWLRGRLAGYKLPHGFHLVRQLPRNATGKVDKLALRQELAGAAADAGETAPTPARHVPPG